MGNAASEYVQDSIIVFGPPKEAALYFDQVVPLHPFDPSDADGERGSVPFISGAPDPAVVQSILGGELAEQHMANLITASITNYALRGGDEFRNFIEEIGSGAANELNAILGLSGLSVGKVLALQDSPEEKEKRLRNAFESLVLPSLERMGLTPRTAVWSPQRRDERSDATTSFYATLADCSAIDSTQLSWEEVLALRSDPSARKALRDLRLFFMEDLRDLDPEQAADHLARSIDEYRALVKGWNLKTAKNALSVITNPQNQIAIPGSMIAILAGGATALAGAFVLLSHLAKAGVEVGQAHIEAKNALTQNPVRYLSNFSS